MWRVADGQCVNHPCYRGWIPEQKQAIYAAVPQEMLIVCHKKVALVFTQHKVKDYAIAITIPSTLFRVTVLPYLCNLLPFRLSVVGPGVAT